MTTLDNPSIAQFLVFKIGKAITKRKEAKAKSVTRMYAWLQTTIRLMLQLAGFSALTIAGFEWHHIAGLVIAGFSCFVLSWLLTSTGNVNQQSNVDPMANRR